MNLDKNKDKPQKEDGCPLAPDALVMCLRSQASLHRQSPAQTITLFESQHPLPGDKHAFGK